MNLTVLAAAASVIRLAVILVALLASVGSATGQSKHVILATTTSTQDSGLLDVLIPLFEQQTGYIVKTIAVGTGQWLALGDRGDDDVVLVHAPQLEREYEAKGTLIHRRLVMHNDFVLVGPKTDPTEVKGLKTAAQALKRIASRAWPFVSRGDNSGTHNMERSLWRLAGVEPGDRLEQPRPGVGSGAMQHDQQHYRRTELVAVGFHGLLPELR